MTVTINIPLLLIIVIVSLAIATGINILLDRYDEYREQKRHQSWAKQLANAISKREESTCTTDTTSNHQSHTSTNQ